MLTDEAANTARHAAYVEWAYSSAAAVAAVEQLPQEQEAMVAQLLRNANEAACWKYHATLIDEDSKARWLDIAAFCEKQAAEAAAKLPPSLVKALIQWTA